MNKFIKRVDKAISELDKLGEKYPDLKIYIEIPGKVAECKLSEANIYLTMDNRIAIDAE